MRKNMYGKLKIMGIFLNIQKAFNCTNHKFDKIRKLWITWSYTQFL